MTDQRLKYFIVRPPKTSVPEVLKVAGRVIGEVLLVVGLGAHCPAHILVANHPFQPKTRMAAQQC